MPHDISLIATITMGLVLAFVGSLVAHRLRLPPLVGYLLAGVALGRFTPGIVGDANLASQLAEIGVILLCSAWACISRSRTCWLCAPSSSGPGARALSESDFSHKAAPDSLPLQDAFAVLFFVSVGTLFDPGILVRQQPAVLPS